MKFILILLHAFFVCEVYGQSLVAGKIVPDDYPVSNDMLKEGDKTIKSGEVISHDKTWFTNDTLKQTLVFEIYTDYHRLCIFNFYNNNIPTSLIDNMELHISTGQLASQQQKQKYFEGFLNVSRKIKKSYFITYKGFKLGDRKDKALQIYGKPNNCSITNGLEECVWKFDGDYTENEVDSKAKKRTLFAKDSYGFSVRMFFSANKLVAMVIMNEIP